MKKTSVIFLQILIVLLAICVLTFMLWEPHLEGRNVSATTFQIYFNDPFLAYAYIGSIAFFVAIYKAFTLLGYIRQNKLLSQQSVKSLRTIKYCAIALVCLVAAPIAYLFIAQPGDDIAGGVAIGLFIILVSAIVAILAKVFEKRLQNAFV